MKFHSHIKYTITFLMMMLTFSMSIFYAATTVSYATESEYEEGEEDTEAVVLFTTEYDDPTILPDLVSNSVIVMDANTGAILYQKNAYEAHYPASITKVMTCLLALENCELDETVTMSYDAVWGIERDSSHIALSVDEQISMEEALYGLMLASANEVAWGIGEHISGTITDFAELMTARAAELGCVNTNFTNANGLHDDNHYTCCYDMALITMEALKSDDFRTITGSVSYTIAPTNLCDEERTVWQHNKLIFPGSYYFYEYCEGGKTGYTSVANHSFVAWAEKDGMELICVLMDCVGSKRTFTDATAIFNYCFNNYDYITPLSDYSFSDDDTAEALTYLNDCFGTSGDQEIALSVDTSYKLAFNANEDASSLKFDIAYADEITINDDGTITLGQLNISYQGDVIATTDVFVSGYDSTLIVYENDDSSNESKIEIKSTSENVSVKNISDFNLDEYLTEHLPEIIIILIILVIVCFVASLIRTSILRKKHHARTLAKRAAYEMKRKQMIDQLDTDLPDVDLADIPDNFIETDDFLNSLPDEAPSEE